MGYLIAAAVVFLFIGLFLFLRPDLFWKLTEQWKSYSADEPSDLYRIRTLFVRAGIYRILKWNFKKRILPNFSGSGGFTGI